MKWLLVTLMAAALAQQPGVDTAEIMRLGDIEQHVNGVSSDPADVFVEAMGPPASDVDKWFISVFTIQGCAMCQKLKNDWAVSPWLLALANPNDPEQSWSHYNVYSREDESQSFRFENIRITAYPTILVQPPLSGRYGDPRTVVFQGTYGGDPERLAQQITTAIRLYVSKFEPSQPDSSIQPPWRPPPKVDPVLPDVTPVFPDGRPLIPPIIDPPDVPTTLAGRWRTVFTVGGTSVLTLLVVLGAPWLLRAIRQWRIESGKPTLLTDEQFQMLLAALEKLSAAVSGLNVPIAKTARSDAPGDQSGTSSTVGGDS